MNKYNTVLGQMLSQIPQPEFEKLVKEKYNIGFTTWTHFSSMFFAQFTGQHGLRSIESTSAQNQRALYHLDFSKEIKRTTIKRD